MLWYLVTTIGVIATTNYLPHEKTIDTTLQTNSPFLEPIRPIIWGTQADVWSAIWEASNKYGISFDVLYSLAICESSLNPNATGDHSLAFGLFQFHKPTFDLYCEGSRYNMKDQSNCAAKMLSEGKEGHWTCYKRAQIMADTL